MGATIETLLAAAKAYDERSQTSKPIESWSEVTKGRFRKTALHFLADLSSLGEKAKAIDRNDNHSSIGRINEKRKLVQVMYDDQQWLRLEKSALESSIGSAHGELFTLKPSTRPDQGPRDTWLWNAVEKRSMAERIEMYLKACETNNTEVMNAIKTAPLPMIDDNTILRGDSARAQRLQPELFQRFVENSELLDALSGMVIGANALAVEYGIETKEHFGELGPRVRAYVQFAAEHPITESNVGKVAKRPEKAAEHANSSETKIAKRPEQMEPVGQD